VAPIRFAPPVTNITFGVINMSNLVYIGLSILVSLAM
jgi:hypothetical protein